MIEKRCEATLVVIQIFAKFRLVYTSPARPPVPHNHHHYQHRQLWECVCKYASSTVCRYVHVRAIACGPTRMGWLIHTALAVGGAG